MNPHDPQPRPDDQELPGEDAGHSAGNCVAATISDVIYFGDHLRLRCQVPEQPEMSVKVPLQHLGHMQAGLLVNLHLPATHLRVYK